MDIHEGSRYYEKLLVGKNFRDVQGIITRVCAICSADHTVAALAALENALGRSRERANLGSCGGFCCRGAAIESHALHVFALALPDFLGFDSVMAHGGPDIPTRSPSPCGSSSSATSIQTIVGGRAVHPVNTLVGGFGKIAAAPDDRRTPARTDLEAHGSSPGCVGDGAHRSRSRSGPLGQTLFMALRPAGSDFGFRGDVICTSDGAEYVSEAYRDTIREFTVEHSHARHAALDTGETYMVGSLARLKLWGDRLGGAAAKTHDVLFPDGVMDNVLLNTRAQLVETVYSVESAIQFCDSYLALDEVEAELQQVEERAGTGIGAIEAPRGTLFHEYELDGDGTVTAANVVTPTAQNLANIECDLRNSGDRLQMEGAVPDAKLKRGFEMIARAYDPCISCSVHVVRVNHRDDDEP